MSTIYHTEPPTHGKVLLRTSCGDIDVELWPKEAPRACRNFVQLALEGYYDNTIFHRIIPKFMVQGGDPTGTGDAGESVWGKPFKDEIHSRIKFNHRGQLAMANENAPNTNKSQFFFTLDKTEWLDKKHTIFGKITGNTIFNALRMGDMDTDGSDRPLDPPKLYGVDVLLNPFDDIVPRASAKAIAEKAAEHEKSVKKAKDDKRKAKKDFKLLSFGEEAEEEESAVQKGGGIRSAHDSLLNDERLSKEQAYTAEELGERTENASTSQTRKDEPKEHIRKEKKTAEPTGELDDEETEGDAFMDRMKQQLRQQHKRIKGKNTDTVSSTNNGNMKNNIENGNTHKSEKHSIDEDIVDYEEDEEEQDELEVLRKEKSDAVKEKTEEFERLRGDLRAKYRPVQVVTGEDREKADNAEAHRDMLSPLEQMRAKYKRQKTQFGSREAETLSKLAAFTSKLKSTGSSAAPVKKESYCGQVTEKPLYEGEDSGDEGGAGWASAPLKFSKHIDDAARAGRGADGRKASDYVVIEPKRKKM